MLEPLPSSVQELRRLQGGKVSGDTPPAEIGKLVTQLNLKLWFKVLTPGVLCVPGTDTVTGSRKPLVAQTQQAEKGGK